MLPSRSAPNNTTPTPITPEAQAKLVAQALADELVAAGGNPNLAAERAGYGRNVDAYITDLVKDPSAYTTLQPLLRTLMMVKLMDLVNQASLSLVSSLSDLEPFEVSKTLTTLMQQLSELTNTKSTTPANINIQEAVFSMVPPHIKHALVQLLPNNGEADGAD